MDNSQVDYGDLHHYYL